MKGRCHKRYLYTTNTSTNMPSQGDVSPPWCVWNLQDKLNSLDIDFDKPPKLIRKSLDDEDGDDWTFAVSWSTGLGWGELAIFEFEKFWSTLVKSVNVDNILRIVHQNLQKIVEEWRWIVGELFSRKVSCSPHAPNVWQLENSDSIHGVSSSKKLSMALHGQFSILPSFSVTSSWFSII